MIWFVLIYIITLILYGVVIYIDMDKGETLQHYWQGTDLLSTVFCILVPVINTFLLMFFSIYKLSEKVWEKIKYWEK